MADGTRWASPDYAELRMGRAMTSPGLCRVPGTERRTSSGPEQARRCLCVTEVARCVTTNRDSGGFAYETYARQRTGWPRRYL